MPFLAAPEVAKACVEFEIGIGDLQICFKFRKPTPTAADYEQLASQVNAQFRGHILPVLSGQLAFTQVRVEPQYAEDAPKYFNATGAGTIGGEPGARLPTQTAYHVTTKGALSDRGSRNAVIIRGFSETDSDNGFPTPAFLSAIQAAVGNFYNSVENNSPWTGCTLSTVKAGVLRTTPLVQDIAEIQYPNVWGTHRPSAGL